MYQQELRAGRLDVGEPPKEVGGRENLIHVEKEILPVPPGDAGVLPQSCSERIELDITVLREERGPVAGPLLVDMTGTVCPG